MKYLRYLALVAALFVPLSYSQGQVRVGIGIGVGPGYYAGAPVCEYGYYPDYPYDCAPYGYYGPTWFTNGIFIGAGPWYHGFGRPFYPVRGFYGYGRSFYGRPYYGRGPVFDRRHVIERGPTFRGRFDDHGYRGREGGGFNGRGFEGRSFDGRGGSSFHGGGRGHR